jgi:hypothetical protein
MWCSTVSMPKVKAFFEGMKSTQLLWVFAVIVSAGISICLIIFRGAKWLSELISSAANGISIALNAGAAMFAYYKNFYMHRTTHQKIDKTNKKLKKLDRMDKTLTELKAMMLKQASDNAVVNIVADADNSVDRAKDDEDAIGNDSSNDEDSDGDDSSDD